MHSEGRLLKHILFAPADLVEDIVLAWIERRYHKTAPPTSPCTTARRQRQLTGSGLRRISHLKPREMYNGRTAYLPITAATASDSVGDTIQSVSLSNVGGAELAKHTTTVDIKSSAIGKVGISPVDKLRFLCTCVNLLWRLPR